jgi:hypothetical protein
MLCPLALSPKILVTMAACEILDAKSVLSRVYVLLELFEAFAGHFAQAA